MGWCLGKVAAARVVAAEAVERDRPSKTFERVTVGSVVIDACRKADHPSGDDVALDGMPGAPRRRGLERQRSRLGLDPLLDAGGQTQQCPEIPDGHTLGGR